jgi:predicted RNA binding protein YcfA (HicA-like mRNA interferase family)
MGQRFPICNANEVIRVLRRNAFVKVGQKGSHQKWRHHDGRQVIVPDHGNKPIPIGTLKSIVEGAKLTVDEFRQSSF